MDMPDFVYIEQACWSGGILMITLTRQRASFFCLRRHRYINVCPPNLSLTHAELRFRARAHRSTAAGPGSSPAHLCFRCCPTWSTSTYVELNTCHLRLQVQTSRDYCKSLHRRVCRTRREALHSSVQIPTRTVAMCSESGPLSRPY